MVEYLKPDTKTVDRLSVRTARSLVQVIGDKLNKLYLKHKAGKLGDLDFYDAQADITHEFNKKLKQLGEVDRKLFKKLKEAVHIGRV